MEKAVISKIKIKNQTLKIPCLKSKGVFILLPHSCHLARAPPNSPEMPISYQIKESEKTMKHKNAECTNSVLVKNTNKEIYEDIRVGKQCASFRSQLRKDRRHIVPERYVDGETENRLEEFCSLNAVQDEIETKWVSMILNAAIERLSAKSQNRIYAYYFEGKTYQQIADMEGVSKVAVCHSIKSALKKLKKILEKDLTFGL